jgi:hypothetical protein
MGGGAGLGVEQVRRVGRQGERPASPGASRRRSSTRAVKRARLSAASPSERSRRPGVQPRHGELYHRRGASTHMGMRAKALIAAGIICAIGIAAAPASAAPPFPRVKFTVPHVEVPVPAARAPLTERDWLNHTSLYEQRLDEAGTPDELAVRETVLVAGDVRLRKAAEACTDGASNTVLQDVLPKEAIEVFSGQGLPEPERVQEDLASTINGCIGENFPQAAAPATEKVSGWLADQAIPAVDRAVENSTTVDASIAWPEGEGSSFPWPVALLGALVGGALLVRAIRRS